MTKIKNTKKGMAKKTLSMSLVVAMLATSNVPVWAAEFSDGSEAVVATEAPAADAVEEFSDNTDTASTTAEAPAVEDTENVEIATAASDYDFSGITVDEKAVNPTWLLKTQKRILPHRQIFLVLLKFRKMVLTIQEMTLIMYGPMTDRGKKQVQME